ncbi:MAG: hypothetical protein VX498_12590, partial [Myxococcota bacterium]|nr:hypothetical protein [Myxococcota bacterium]
MLLKARSASATLIASMSLLLVLASCTPGDDDPDIVLPLESTGLALSSSGTGTPGLPTTVEGSRTQVWEISNDWADTDTPAARQAGMAWPANSGLNWEQKFSVWVEKLQETQAHGSSRRTFMLTNPMGKELPI